MTDKAEIWVLLERDSERVMVAAALEEIRRVHEKELDSLRNEIIKRDYTISQLRSDKAQRRRELKVRERQERRREREARKAMKTTEDLLIEEIITRLKVANTANDFSVLWNCIARLASWRNV